MRLYPTIARRSPIYETLVECRAMERMINQYRAGAEKSGERAPKAAQLAG